MKENIKATITVSNYASKGILMACIKALYAQDCDDYEVILPDLGNFTVEEASMLDKFEKEHKTFRILKVRGKNRAELINKAASISKGNLLLFTESHCIPSKKWVSNYIKLFEDEKIQVARGSRNSVPCELMITRCSEAFFQKIKKDFSFYLDFHNAAIRKSCFNKMNGVDNKLPRMAEFELGARMHNNNIRIFQYLENEVYHIGDKDFFDYITGVIQQGKERTNMFFKNDPLFTRRYFPNRRFAKLLPFLKLFRLPLLLAAKSSIYAGFAGLKLGEYLHLFRLSEACFAFAARSGAAHGRISALKKYKK